MELHLVGSPSADGISALSAVAKGLPESGWENINVRNSGSGTGVGVSWFKGPDRTYPHHHWQGCLDQVAAYDIGLLQCR